MFDRVCQTFDEFYLGTTHSAPSVSDVAPVSLQSRTLQLGSAHVATSIYGMRKRKIIETLNSVNRRKRRLLHVCKTVKWQPLTASPHLSPLP